MSRSRDPLERIEALRVPTGDDPLRILVSGCLARWPCGVDGGHNGVYPVTDSLFRLPTARVLAFCPEDHAFGSPRDCPDIHGGDGYDVLEGRAHVRSDRGADWTDGMVRAAEAMWRFARDERVELAILMDISAACGSSVIYLGARRERRYRRGPGVAAARLLREGLLVISQRDFRCLEHVRRKLDPTHEIDMSARDHVEGDWYRAYFADGGATD